MTWIAPSNSETSRLKGPSLFLGLAFALLFLLALPLEVAMAERSETPEKSGSTSPAAADSGEHEAHEGLLFVHGRLRAGAEKTYGQYVAGTGPLIAEYGGEVRAVGAAAEDASDVAPAEWPVNALLAFPSVQAAKGFLSDPRYLELKKNYRDQAYEELHLTLVRGRAPRVRTPQDVAEEAFEHLKHGLATGEWQPWLDRLHDDFVFRFPMGQYQGDNHGKAKAEEFFPFVSSVYPTGLFVKNVERVTASGQTVVFEFLDEGEMRGKPYRNHVAISLDVCGEKICRYREYFGLVGPPPAKEGEP